IYTNTPQPATSPLFPYTTLFRSRSVALRLRGPRRAGELPPRAVGMARQPARLVGERQRVLPQALARYRFVAAGRGSAGERAAPGRDVAGRSADRQARPPAHARLPDDVHDDVVRRRAPRGHLVREARPEHHG